MAEMRAGPEGALARQGARLALLWAWAGTYSADCARLSRARLDYRRAQTRHGDRRAPTETELGTGIVELGSTTVEPCSRIRARSRHAGLRSAIVELGSTIAELGLQQKLSRWHFGFPVLPVQNEDEPTSGEEMGGDVILGMKGDNYFEEETGSKLRTE
ncbi:hypothetical protein KSP39_PZI018357 [Platanthera zijinensis]|uniref:Uncharacterized protein n=1 Tax=Platanthera zijinensis TaxID=2320716 RepID=A0AAP0B3Z2_9ASPA